MDDSLNRKVCYFCGEPSKLKYVIDPQTRVLNEAILTAYFSGREYPVCEKCAKIWDVSLNALRNVYEKSIARMFETLVAKKGVLTTDAEPQKSQ